MKRVIRSARDISEKYVNSPIDNLKSKLGISWGSNKSIRPISEGKWNFVLSDRYSRLSQSDPAISDLKKAGAKYITPRYGNIYFFYDLTDDQKRYDEEKQAARDEYLSKLDAVDVSMYIPTDAIIKKLMDYRAKGSKVNVKAIKDPIKLLTYYYAAKLIGWDDLAQAIRQVADFEYSDEIKAIARRVKAEEKYSDARNEDDIELGLADSKGLFTFDQRNNSGKVSCWLPKSILQYLINNNIPVHFGKRTSGSRWDRNGAQWSEVEHLTLFPGTEDAIDYEIVVHTNERADGSIPTTYTSGDTAERVSAKQIIEGLDRRLKREGIIQSSTEVRSKKYIRNSSYDEDEYYDEDSYFVAEDDNYIEDSLEDDGSGLYVVELYEDKYKDPVRKYFSTGDKALKYAEKIIAKQGDKFESIYINRRTVNGPLNLMVYEDQTWYGDRSRLS